MYTTEYRINDEDDDGIPVFPYRISNAYSDDSSSRNMLRKLFGVNFLDYNDLRPKKKVKWELLKSDLLRYR